MKKFNIVKQDVILWEKYHLPINSCFGCFTCDYKKRVGNKSVTTKHGQVIEKPRYKDMSEDIIYYVDNFKPIIFSDGQAIRLHVYNKNRDKWENTHTLAHPKFKQLHIFLLKMFEKNNIDATRMCKYWIDTKTNAPREKKPQIHSDSVFRVSVGYALSKNVMTMHNVNRDGWAYNNTNIAPSI